MPIISKVRLERLAEIETSDEPRPDYSLLILCVKLILKTPESLTDALLEPLYVFSKAVLHTLDLNGVHTMLKLQAMLLLTVYEMGHGLFPAAYISLGHCVTQALALGVHSIRAPQMLEKPRNWIELEERIRVWWMILILDRSEPFLSGD